jgi:ABC-type branched-subunit amino acid transport system substrate-binding protein
MTHRHLRFGALLALTSAMFASLALVSANALDVTELPSAQHQYAAQVVVARGQPVEIAFTAVTQEGPLLAAASRSFENAIQMAIEDHSAVRGFPIQVNSVETSCFGDNAASAAAIVANPQNTAVLGNICSLGFESALPIYELAGVVTITGSASASFLPPLGPTVFNRTVVVIDADGDPGDIWLSQVSTLPSVLAWEQEYEARFGEPPGPFPALAALYFDSASLLLRRLQQVSRIVDGNLVIDRHALASEVRSTTKFQGVTCTVELVPATGNRVNDPAALTRCEEA